MNQTKLLFPLIFFSLKDDSDIIIPPQPTSPGEIMSGGEGEPIEADEPEESENDTTPAETERTISGVLASTETVTHEYLTQSGKVVRETITTSMDTTTLDFFYDESGRPFAFNYTPEGSTPNTYYYILNLQGDVVQIIDEGGVMQAEYVYSPWGEIISAEGDLAEINPLRYRGYYYDSETGFYYLQSRYYDPENHRFINADTYASTDSGNSIASNMFAYCGNNPIIRSDDDGQFWHIIVGAVIGATVGAISAAIQGKGTAGILAGAVLGAASGALAASGAGVVAQTIGSGVLSMAENAIDQVEDIAKDKTNKKKFSVGSMLIDGAIGAVAGAAGGNGASYGNAKSINQAGKQLLKRGLLNPQARAYYAKVAHNAAKEYVFAPLLKSLGYGTIGKAVSAFANWAESRWLKA